MRYNVVVVLADGSYGPLNGARLIAVPENSTAEDIEDIIDSASMFDHNPSDFSEGWVIADITEPPRLGG